MASPFSSSPEFKDVMDRLFTMMSEDPEMGPALAGGDVKASLALIPIVKPIYERYREMVAEQYPHLVV